MKSKKELLLLALHSFIRQRPGLEFGNYGDRKAYFSEMRSITRDRHHAEALLSAVALRDSITAEQILEASKHAYSGRLTITETPEGGYSLSYCTGQYFPTEYRRAVCAVLSQALWDYWRENVPSESERPGDFIRSNARQIFGPAIAERWFN